MIVEHDDGTLAYYNGFKKGSFRVKPGDVVFPSTALGINERLEKERGYFSSLYVGYLKNIHRDPITNLMTNSGDFYGFVTPIFVTEGEEVILEHGNKYTSSLSQVHLEKEMSKREIKQWVSGN